MNNEYLAIASKCFINLISQNHLHENKTDIFFNFYILIYFFARLAISF